MCTDDAKYFIEGPNRGQAAGSGAVVVSGVCDDPPSHIMERWSGELSLM